MSQSPHDPAEDADPSPRFGPPARANPLWRVVLVSGALFCVSCLMWITAGFADPAAPGNQWLNRNGLLLVAVTGAVSIGSSWIAMWVDARQTRRRRAETEANVPESHP